LNILQLNTSDQGGGTERFALQLHRAFRSQYPNATLLVGERKTNTAGVVSLFTGKKPPLSLHLRSWVTRRIPAGYLQKSAGKWAFQLGKWLEPKRTHQVAQGLEDFNFPSVEQAIQKGRITPDIIQIHNLHGGWIDVRTLPAVSQRIPLSITLHDQWLLTGHCAYSLDCTRWHTGCGNCPYLESYPAIAKDATAQNFTTKRAILAKARLNLVTPSRWLADCVLRSGIPYQRLRVIPNGIDLQLFFPLEKAKARLLAGLPQDKKLLLILPKRSANNSYYDNERTRQILQALAQQLPPVNNLLCLFLGGSVNIPTYPTLQTLHIPFQTDPTKVSACFQAADLFLHTPKSDNFPTTILEALACGTPVAASHVGGIPEQIIDGETGLLLPESPTTAAHAIFALLESDERLHGYSAKAATYARQNFGFEQMLQKYLEWYAELITTV
jgi:glycosyltransferase involved in cell wall biosynthesis